MSHSSSTSLPALNNPSIVCLFPPLFLGDAALNLGWDEWGDLRGHTEFLIDVAQSIEMKAVLEGCCAYNDIFLAGEQPCAK